MAATKTMNSRIFMIVNLNCVYKFVCCKLNKSCDVFLQNNTENRVSNLLIWSQ